MISAKKKEELTAENILKKIDDWMIYKWYAGDFRVGECFLSPMRNEKNPSFIIKVDDRGKLHHKDYADSSFQGGCFDFIMQKFSCSYNDALLKVDSDFQLGFMNKPIKPLSSIVNTLQKPIMNKKVYTFIQVKTRKFTKEDLIYWNSYLITEEELKRENIFSIKEAYLNRSRIPIGKDELAFAYF